MELLVGSQEDVLVTQLIDRHSSLASDHCVDSTNLAYSVVLKNFPDCIHFLWQIGDDFKREVKWEYDHNVLHTLLATSQATSKHHWLLSLGGNYF